MKSLIVKVLAFTVLLGTPLLAAENNVKELSTQLAKNAIELESNEHDVIKSFIKKYIISDELQKFMTDKKLDGIVKNFMKTKKDRLRLYMLATSKMTPNISKDNLLYTFTKKNDKSNTLKEDLSFVYSEKTKIFHIKN